MNEPIMLADVVEIRRPKQFKLHLACTNADGVRPLDEYVADKARWIAWNEYRGEKNRWLRPYIFSFVELYPIKHAHLFAGAFEVTKRLPDRYEVREVEEFEKWNGRLICRYRRLKGMKGSAFNLENLIDSFEVHQILPARYIGE